ncbi:MAG: bifunctional diaminohydroxyphosphoribosylaminopyrimidine deaminase/5-amino-6-(5-phosphoribosylamino)uracil reductase RibD [Desulfobacteraceae bacterium]|nr:bifunctional diaminohydroxyphosphoribosylaminopyrimidine deaminase/5-amino-6-(5-phosphoribosylamino)uracil reductase RibD [Desulfobacteraceae bacterium]
MDDLSFMKKALDLAEKGRGFTAPNPMVGAVVVRNGQVVGRGYHEAVGRAHAEVNAIEDAGPHARGAHLYVTLEPCNHTGRTPPCTRKIIDAGIKKVFSAMDDPNPDVAGGGHAYLESNGIDVQTGLLNAEAEKLNEAYIKFVRTRRPFVIMKCAATLDGRIATRTGDARWVTGSESRARVHEIRHGADAILVGINTVLADDPSLTTRLDGKTGKDPERVILDTRLRIGEAAKVITRQSDAGTLIFHGPEVDRHKRERVSDAGATLISTSVMNGGLDWREILDRLGQRAITSLLVEGGAAVIGSALAAGVVDKALFFYAPKILGGDDGIPICRGKGPALMAAAQTLKDIRVTRYGEDTLIEGYL